MEIVAVGIASFIAGIGFARGYQRARASRPFLGKARAFLEVASGESDHEWHVEGKHDGKVVRYCTHCGAVRKDG